jgi:hypothetical protein
MTHRPFLIGVLIATAVAAMPARAAPFCVQLSGIPLQCIYADPAICQQEANRQGGRCAANPDEYKTPAGGSAFCVVQSGNVSSCIFSDRASCDNEADRIHGACIAATPVTPPKAVDPYELKRPY